MRIRDCVAIVLFVGVKSLTAEKIEYQKYEKNIHNIHKDDDERGLQIDWAAFALELAERNKPTPQPTRSGSWGIITRFPTAGQITEPPDRTRFPTKPPTSKPSSSPSVSPTDSPSRIPSDEPSSSPSSSPSAAPSKQPSNNPSSFPSASPSTNPTMQPSRSPSEQPTSTPSSQPSSTPSATPSSTPSGEPTSSPSASPSLRPSASPSSQPTKVPSASPSSFPSSEPSAFPSITPTNPPSASPSSSPSMSPSILPTLDEKNSVQVTLQAGRRSGDGMTFTVLGSTVVIVIGAILVKRGVVKNIDDDDKDEEYDIDENQLEMDEEKALPPSNVGCENVLSRKLNGGNIEERCASSGHKIIVPLPPSAAIDTRTYKSKERSGLAPLHHSTSRRHATNEVY